MVYSQPSLQQRRLSESSSLCESRSDVEVQQPTRAHATPSVKSRVATHATGYPMILWTTALPLVSYASVTRVAIC